MSVHDRTPENGATRQQRKQRTREALLDAALELLEGESFSSLSLRQVTRAAGIVPTAFYRHFDDMEELGLVLIDESFRTLRAMLRAARADPRTYERVISNSVEILVDYVHEHDTHFRFIARERFGGVAALRHAIRREIRLFASDLATDLARFPYLNRWSTEDLQLLAGLMVNTMVSTAEAILDAPPHDPAAEAEIIAAARRQLRMITLGVLHWCSSAAQPLLPTGASAVSAMSPEGRAPGSAPAR
jgi:AcrR family transcriptional regulator